MDERNAETRFDVPPDSSFYDALVSEVAAFFRGGDAPVKTEDTLEIMAMLDAGERSYRSGRAEWVQDRGARL